MPNTLVHFATQGAATRSALRRLDARWVYLGCLLPDLPWILRRAVVGFGIGVDPYDLRLYTMAQASLAGTALLCAALAAIGRRPRLVFGVLGLNVMLHLLVDALEVKWGNGVHLLAPVSWRMTTFDLVSGERNLVLWLSVIGGLVVTWEILRRGAPTEALCLGRRRLAIAFAFVAAYFVFPLPFLQAIEASDSYSVGTLRDVAGRVGRVARFDRTAFLRGASGPQIEVWSGERLAVTGQVPTLEGSLSLEGTFVTPTLLRIDRYVEHRSRRDVASYAALGLLGLLFLRPFVDRRRKGSGRDGGAAGGGARGHS